MLQNCEESKAGQWYRTVLIPALAFRRQRQTHLCEFEHAAHTHSIAKETFFQTCSKQKMNNCHTSVGPYCVTTSVAFNY